MGVNGSAIRPVCHFDLPSTDYRERRAQTNLSVLDPKIRVRFHVAYSGRKVMNSLVFGVLLSLRCRTDLSLAAATEGGVFALRTGSWWRAPQNMAFCCGQQEIWVLLNNS